MTIVKKSNRAIAPSRDVGLRIPTYVVDALDAFCVQHGITRTDMVVGLVKAHLGIKSPAEMALEKKQ